MVLTDTGPEIFYRYPLGDGASARVRELVCRTKVLATKGRLQLRLNVPIELCIVSLVAVTIAARIGQDLRKLNVLGLGFADVLRRYRCGHKDSLNP